MDQQVKQRWIDALRSGKYKQTDGHLQDQAGFCCLGVLCDIVQSEVDGDWSLDDGFYIFTDSSGVGDTALTPAVAERCGLPTGNSHQLEVKTIPIEAVKNDNRVGRSPSSSVSFVSLAQLNDWGFTFDEIADLIEEYL